MSNERTSDEILGEISAIRNKMDELYFANDRARYLTPGSADISERNAQIAELQIRLSEISPLYWEARKAEGKGGPFENDNKSKNCF